MQPGLGQAQQAQHQCQAGPALVTGKGRKNFLGLVGVERLGEDGANDHISRDQGHGFLGIDAEFSPVGLADRAGSLDGELPLVLAKVLGCLLGPNPFNHGLHRVLH